MKIVRVGKLLNGRKHGAREIEVPETYDEGYNMMVEAMNPYYDKRGGDRQRMSAVGRVAFGLFKPHAIHPTAALIELLRDLCRHEGEWHNDAENEGEAPSPRGR